MKSPARKLKTVTPPGGRTADPFGDLDLDELFENAIRSNDPVFRERMALLALEHLRGSSLPPQVVDWLRWVLRGLLLNEAIPTLAKGRPTDSLTRLMRQGDLYLYLDRLVDVDVNKALDRAAVELGPWVHTFYKSRDFVVWRKMLRRSRARK